MSAELLAFALRGHLVSMAAWSVGLMAVTWIQGLGYGREVAAYPGGGAGFAQSLEAAAVAMRPFRWPAEGLDTFAGYITYHNFSLLPLVVGAYALVQGAQAIRGPEDRGWLDAWLATGCRPRDVLLARAGAFLLGLGVVTVGLAAGTALALAAAGEPVSTATLVSAASVTLVAAALYGLGLVAAELVGRPRTAAGIVVTGTLALYVLTNIWDLVGPIGAVRFLSPFYYRHQLDALLPGHTADPLAAAVLVVGAALPLAAAAVLVERRELHAAAWRVRIRRAQPRVALGSPWLRSLWTLTLREERLALASWTASLAAFVGLAVWIGPQVTDVWGRMPLVRQLLVRHPEVSILDQYLAVVAVGLGLVAAAYAVFATARWDREATEERVEMVLSCPFSRARLVLERVLAVAVGQLVITAGALAAWLAGSAAIGLPVRLDGLVRLSWDMELLALAVAGIGALLLPALRGALVGVLAALLAAAYLLTLLVPLFGWPEGVLRLSLFDAFGDPYISDPTAIGIAVLAGAALCCTAGAVLLGALRRDRPV